MKKQDSFYFDNFIECTHYSLRAAQLLMAVMNDYDSSMIEARLDEMHQIEHGADTKKHEMLAVLMKAFMTPIEREDIIELAKCLDDIIDYIEDVIQCMYMYDVHYIPEGTKEFADLIRKGTGALGKAMGDFRSFKKSKKFRALVHDVNDYEEVADRLFLKVIRKLHTTDRDNPMRAHVWSRVFERMEKCCDACEHAADTMSTIMLKNV